MTDRAYSTIAVKSLNEDERTFAGLATSPAPDRVLDIIEPLGCKYNNPTVLLRAHAHDAPIGAVQFGRPTKAGITFTARIPKIPEPGLLKDRVDMAWGEIKHGLVRAVSIGFRPTAEPERLPSGGLRFPKTEIYELSTVAVPAQELATIDHIKAIDAAVRRGETPAAAYEAVAGAGRKAVDELQFCKEHMDELKAVRAADGKHVLYTQGQHDMIREGFTQTFVAIAVLRNIVGELEDKLEQQGRAYKGVWKAGQTYPAGSFCSYAGSMWHADQTTDFKPGEGGGWTLAVKRGADAK